MSGGAAIGSAGADAEVIFSARGVCIDFHDPGPIWRRTRVFRALDAVSFQIRRGEAVGIIGRNGAGKSSLLRIMAGIIRPSDGTIHCATPSVTLLALGAGYEGSLPASANVVLNGMLLGLSRREIESKLDAIFDFAELDDFRDAPVRTYSSGMVSRLAFATAMQVKPELLLIDEIFAVGDRYFRAKSSDAMRTRIRDDGQTVVMVSHQVRTVERLCDRVLWFDGGKLIADGDAKQVVKRYQDSAP